MNLSFEYTPFLDDAKVKGIDSLRPWNLLEEIKKHAGQKKHLLDIGCGTGKKLLHLLDSFEMIVGLEPNKAMYSVAADIAKKHRNLLVLPGYAQFLPFKDERFDVISNMLAPHHSTEVYRTLKKDGIFIAEKTGDLDKQELSDFFEPGRIGYLYKKNNQCKKELKNFFSKVLVKEGTWKTKYTIDGLELLLTQTPTVKNFNIGIDKQAFANMLHATERNGFIELTQHRLLIFAEK